MKAVTDLAQLHAFILKLSVIQQSKRSQRRNCKPDRIHYVVRTVTDMDGFHLKSSPFSRRSTKQTAGSDSIHAY